MSSILNAFISISWYFVSDLDLLMISNKRLIVTRSKNDVHNEKVKWAGDKVNPILKKKKCSRILGKISRITNGGTGPRLKRD